MDDTNESVIRSSQAYQNLGFDSAPLVQSSGGHAIAWTSRGVIMASGGPAAFITALASKPPHQQSKGPALSNFMHALPSGTNPFVAAVSRASATVPLEGDDPSTWLARIVDLERVKEWVLSSGLASRRGTAWADLARALGWELPIPAQGTTPAAEPTQGEGTSAPQEGTDNASAP